MILKVFDDKSSLGKAAAEEAAVAMRHAIAEKGRARILVATGASQFEFLEALTKTPALEWEKVEMFPLDEYSGLSLEHPASFGRYLLERLVRKTGIQHYHLLNGKGDPAEECHRVGGSLAAAPVDVAFVGIGENGHLAFNDPPADFETEEPYLVVHLDEACRRQQVGEGWFSSVEEVPEKAMSISIRQILKSKQILCVVPDARKARAVKVCLEGEISPLAPASILRTHDHVTVFLDRDSASLLSPEVVARGRVE